MKSDICLAAAEVFVCKCEVVGTSLRNIPSDGAGRRLMLELILRPGTGAGPKSSMMPAVVRQLRNRAWKHPLVNRRRRIGAGGDLRQWPRR